MAATATTTPQILPPKRSEDVTIYRRHTPACAAKNNDCTCPLWLYEKKTQKRFSARTTSWSRAEIEKQKILDSYDPVKKRLAELERKHEYGSVLLSDAVAKFEKYKLSEGIARSTLTDYLSTINQMAKFMHHSGVSQLRDISKELMNDWKIEQWETVTRSRARRKVRTHIRMFFNWAILNQGWLDRDENPADALLVSKIKNRKQKEEEVVPAIPFYDDQYDAILDAALLYDLDPRPGMKGMVTAQKLHALIQLMRWSGLAIQDAVNVDRSRIDAAGVLTLRRAKTGEKVTVPLPDWVLDELYALPVESDGFFYDNQHCRNPHARAVLYATAFRRLFPTVNWPRPVQDGAGNPIAPHSHMLRHTFAYWWLVTKHQDIRDLQILLGHSSLATTEGNYAHWMGDAAKALNDRVRTMHGPTLVEAAKKEPAPEHRIRVRHATAGRFRSTISR